jgi:cellulose synthase/poly-beta-1,6-N-acetylglucosamine synthase-like glycosyltransferase
MARGVLIAFTDSDCAADPGWITNGVAAMTEGVGLVQGKTLPDPGQELRPLSLTQKVTWEDGLYQSCNIFYRKEILEKLGGFSPDFCGVNRLGIPRWGGEDTDLAWRVKKAGWKSVFSERAVIHHHVFPLTPLEAIYSQRKFLGLFHVLPYLFKKYPELRKLLYGRFFLSKGMAFFDLFLVSILLGLFIHPVFLLPGLPYLLFRVRELVRGRSLHHYPEGLKLMITYVLSDLVSFVLLAAGSIRHRTIVL